MSVFDPQGPPLAGAGGASGGSGADDGHEPDSHGEPPADSTGRDPAATVAAASSYDPHGDARSLVRLVQCQRCSLPLRTPLTLACGNSLCRSCLPTTYKREHITYPATQGRSEGFMCPFAECGKEHSLGDCGVDVTLSRLLERVGVEMAKYRPLTSDTPMRLDEQPAPHASETGSEPDSLAARSRVLHGGRLVATYTMAEIGELRYDADVAYQTQSPTGDDYRHLDYGMLEHLREMTRSELDCQVCFALMLDPLTLACGHTFCRKCVVRVLDHAQKCPACRRPLALAPSVVQAAETNKRLSKLLFALCPEQVAVRQEQAQAEEAELAQKQHIPLFICTLAYPRVPTFLHIFEPRYRLMIRRAMETDRKFGMLAYNGRGEPQGELGVTQFLQYGTLLEIVNMHLFDNGRSIVETIGVSRFCVRAFSMHDGYTVGRVERIDDVPVAEEEAFESRQVAGLLPTSAALAADPVFAGAPHSGGPGIAHDPALEATPTVQLMAICTDFIRRMRSASAHWLADHIIQAYGPMPDDPAVFPYWFASVLPINEAEKYRLLPTRSVRVRLMVCAEWVRRVERTRWYARLRDLIESGSLAALASLHDGRGDPDEDDPDNENNDDQTADGPSDSSSDEEYELALPPLEPIPVTVVEQVAPPSAAAGTVVLQHTPEPHTAGAATAEHAVTETVLEVHEAQDQEAMTGTTAGSTFESTPATSAPAQTADVAETPSSTESAPLLAHVAPLTTTAPDTPAPPPPPPLTLPGEAERAQDHATQQHSTEQSTTKPSAADDAPPTT